MKRLMFTIVTHRSRPLVFPRKYEKRRKKSAGNVIFVVSLQPVPWYIKNNPPTLIVAGIRKLGYVL